MTSHVWAVFILALLIFLTSLSLSLWAGSREAILVFLSFWLGSMGGAILFALISKLIRNPLKDREEDDDSPITGHGTVLHFRGTLEPAEPGFMDRPLPPEITEQVLKKARPVGSIEDWGESRPVSRLDELPSSEDERRKPHDYPPFHP